MVESSDDLFKVRLEKLARIRARGIDPYPPRSKRTHTSKEATSLFEAREQGEDGDARTETVTVTGRMVGFRDMGRTFQEQFWAHFRACH